MKEDWTYDRVKRVDDSGKRWHFVRHSFRNDGREYRERPVEWYFRDDARSVFGVFRIEHQKDFPYRNYETMIRSIMNKPALREELLDPTTEAVWERNWK